MCILLQSGVTSFQVFKSKPVFENQAPTAYLGLKQTVNHQNDGCVNTHVPQRIEWRNGRKTKYTLRHNGPQIA